MDKFLSNFTVEHANPLINFLENIQINKMAKLFFFSDFMKIVHIVFRFKLKWNFQTEKNVLKV